MSTHNFTHIPKLLKNLLRNATQQLFASCPLPGFREGTVLTPDDLIVADKVVRFAEEPARTNRRRKGHLPIRLPIGPAGAQLLLLPIGTEVRDIYYPAAAAGTAVQDVLFVLVLTVDDVQHTILERILLIEPREDHLLNVPHFLELK